MILILELMTFGFAWWLGLKLLQRRDADAASRLMGLGLMVYAATLVLRSLRLLSDESVAASMTTIEIGLTLIPLVLWLVALSTLLPKLRASAENQSTRALLIVFTISLGLGIGLILLRTNWLPDSLLLLAIGIDLLILGYAVGVLDAFEQGETVKADFLRSFLESEAVAWLFGGQIAIVMWLTSGVTLPMMALLYTVIASAIALTVFFNRIQEQFDRLAFGRNPTLRQERTTLRDMAAALPRSLPDSAEIDWTAHDLDQLTRRALSNMGNLPKLATSPLRLLPQIDQRLSSKGLDDSVLARSAELKQLLTESICKLKPVDDGHFETNDSWRHYNALYFPYIRGLRPYSRRFVLDDLDETDRRAMEWFQREVPPRTLYNWQAAAAKLISAELQQHLKSTV